MTNPERIEVRNRGGVIQVIPRAWLDHPIFGSAFTPTPRTKKRLAALDAELASHPGETGTPDAETTTTAPKQGGTRAARTAATTTTTKE